MFLSCASQQAVIIENGTKDNSGTKEIVDFSSLEKQINLEKHKLSLIEAGDSDSIFFCISGEDSQSISELARMSVLFQADTIIKDWYKTQTIAVTDNDSADPPSWIDIPDGVAYGEKGFYIVGYGEAASESMSSGKALMNARMRIGRLFADSLTDRLGAIDDEVYDIVSRFGAMIALYGTQESERYTDRSGSRKKSYSLIVLNQEDISRNIVINIANQLKQFYRKDRQVLIQIIQKGNFRDYQTVLRVLYQKRIDSLEQSVKK
jgi:hypothetical protein